MRVGRSVIPPGKAGVVILAAALVPVVLRKLKPVAKAVGQGISKVGETMVKLAEEPHDPVKTEKVDVAPAEPAAKPAAAKAARKRKPAPKRPTAKKPA